MFQIDWSGPVGLVVAIAAVVAVTGLVIVFMMVKLISKHRLVHQPGTPASVKFAYYASIAYAVFPLDLVADPILIDDIGVLAGSLIYISRMIKKVKGRQGAIRGARPAQGHEPQGGQPRLQPDNQPQGHRDDLVR